VRQHSKNYRVFVERVLNLNFQSIKSYYLLIMLFESSKEEDCQSQATKDVSDSTSSPNPKIGPALAVAVSNIEKAKEEE